MLQRVHTVLIGKSAPASYTNIDALAEGAVALFDQDMKLITTVAAAADANALYVGVAGPKMNVTMPDGSVEQKANIEYSTRIDKNSKPSAVVGEYTAPVQEKIEIDMTSAVITVGNRYVIRIYYKDLYEAKWQFTHTYEIYATSTTASDLATAFMNKINAHKGRRVQASVSSAKLTLTALEKTDNEGVNSINQYSIVSMEASLYETIPGALLSNQPEAVSGVTITKTVGNPGKGYWKQVRDAERTNMGYKGQVYEDAYPVVMQERKVVAGTEYDYIIIENDNLYLSNDNQYIKTTPLTIEVYCPDMASSIVANGIKSFIAGEDVTA